MKFGDPFAKEVAQRNRKGLAGAPRTARLAVFPDTDPRFEIVSPNGTNEVISYRGFFCECSKPHYHWSVTRTPTGGDIPSALAGSFTNRERVLLAIDTYLKTEKEKRA